jgi:hypothetical protein
MSKLKNGGINVVVAGTDAALNLLKVSDPEGHYVDIEKMVNIDQCIESLAKKKMDFDLCFVFVHNDLGYLILLLSKAYQKQNSSQSSSVTMLISSLNKSNSNVRISLPERFIILFR